MAVDPAHRKRRERRILIGLAAAALLGTAGAFIGLVVFELQVEQRLDVSHPTYVTLSWGGGSHPIFDRDATTLGEAQRVIEEWSGVPVHADWATLRTRGVTADTPFHHPTTPAGLGGGTLLFKPRHAIDTLADYLGPDVAWYIQVDHVILTTKDNLPRFDASAKAREWYHAAVEWWNGR